MSLDHSYFSCRGEGANAESANAWGACTTTLPGDVLLLPVSVIFEDVIARVFCGAVRECEVVCDALQKAGKADTVPHLSCTSDETLPVLPGDELIESHPDTFVSSGSPTAASDHTLVYNALTLDCSSH